MWRHEALPLTLWSCHVPRQIPTWLPGLVLDIELFPLGARCLENKAQRLGLPRQTLALGTIAPAHPFWQVFARARLGWLCPQECRHSTGPIFWGKQRHGAHP